MSFAVVSILKVFALGVRMLIDLTCAGCLGLDESVAIYIADARYCRHINNIEFDWCRNFGDVGMFWLGTGCSQTLTNISLSHTTVSRSGLHAVADK